MSNFAPYSGERYPDDGYVFRNFSLDGARQFRAMLGDGMLFRLERELKAEGKMLVERESERA